jgi:hypothetical protein
MAKLSYTKSSRLLQSLKTSQRFFLCFLRFQLPLVDADVSSKKYVDDQINFAVVASAAGLDVKQSVRTATTANVGTYTATASTRGQITGAPNVLELLRLLQQIES